MRFTEPSATPDAPRHCEHCGQHTNRWAWRMIEVYPVRTYEAVCNDCAAKQNATFTEENAICAAIIVIGIRRGILDRKARTW